MAGKTKRMSQIKQLLQLHQQGHSKKEMSRILGMSKNTVKTYLMKLGMLKEGIEELLKLDDPVLATRFHPGNPAYSDGRFDDLQLLLEGYSKELRHTGVTMKLLWEEYREHHPAGYGKTQFCYHLSQHLRSGKPSMVLEHKPAEKLFVDFAGKKLSYIDRQTGELIECHVFVACLPYSDYSFVMALRSQGIEDFLYALRCCLEDFGGVPQVLVSDNLKSAIIRASSYEPEVNRALEDFANHYGMTILPARAYKPKDKALVENHVKLIYTRIYARLRKEIFFDLKSLNEAIFKKARDHNQTRMQQKPYSRQECFLANEKPLLGSLPEGDFELKYYRQYKVAKNNHINLGEDKHYYSVPYKHIGANATVIYTRSMVYIYVSGQQVAVHQRNRTPGRYSTDKEHLCSHHRHYLDRSPEYYIEKARGKGEIFSQLVIALFGQNRHPEQLYRTCDGYLSLERKTNPETFARACALALDYQNYSYHFLVNVIKNNMTDQQHEPTINQSLPQHANIRGSAYYKQTQLNF
jgi:transposase